MLEDSLRHRNQLEIERKDLNHDSMLLFIPGDSGGLSRVVGIVEDELEEERGVAELVLTEILREIDRPILELSVRRRMIVTIDEKCREPLQLTRYSSRPRLIANRDFGRLPIHFLARR